MTLDDIDFAALYRDHMQRHGIVPRPAEAWNQRAPHYGRHGQRAHAERGTDGNGNTGSAAAAPLTGYAHAFLSRMDLGDAATAATTTVLDVGCGPGTLALPLARIVRQVVALDYSPAMLDQLRQNALAQGLDNIHAVHRAWEDDWSDIPVCDIAIASRSTLVPDMGAALRQLDAKARRQACLTYLVGGHHIDPQVQALLDPPPPPMPDHLLLMGMLRQMGRLPSLDFISTPSRLAGATDFADFLSRIEWAQGPVSEAARERLRQWHGADPVRTEQGGAPMRWALIRWAT